MEQLIAVQGAIKIYFDKYKSRLQKRTTDCILMITHVVASIIKYLSNKSEGTINMMDFLEATDLYKVDLTETLTFLQNSDFTKKLNGFMQS